MSRWLWSEFRLFRSRGVQAIIPTALLFAVSGLALTLTAGIIARSPYTHGNLSPAGYDRTDVIYLGEKLPVQRGPAGKDSRAEPAISGRALFIGLNCAACHGLKGQGGVFAPVIVGTDAETLATYTRKSPSGMPSFEGLTEDDLNALAAFLRAETPPSVSAK